MSRLQNIFVFCGEFPVLTAYCYQNILIDVWRLHRLLHLPDDESKDLFFIPGQAV